MEKQAQNNYQRPLVFWNNQQNPVQNYPLAPHPPNQYRKPSHFHPALHDPYIQHSTDWHPSKIHHLFQLYDKHGSKWKTIQLQMPDKTPNNLKNQFYTVLRNLLKLIFRNYQNICPKVVGEIYSRDLSRLYDAKEEYQEFNGFLKDLLIAINYDLKNQGFKDYLKDKKSNLIKVYKIIYRDRLSKKKVQNPIEVPAESQQSLRVIPVEAKKEKSVIENVGEWNNNIPMVFRPEQQYQLVLPIHNNWYYLQSPQIYQWL